MDIKQIKTFICIAETGSLSGASDRLRIAQPALSRQIKLLEHEIGTPLFFESTFQLIYQLEKSVNDIQSTQGEIKGSVTIGLLPTSNTMFIVRLVEQIRQQLPHVKLHLVEGYSAHLVEWLQKGRLDISFLNGPATDLHLSCKELIYEDIALISATDSCSDFGDTITLADIAGLPLILPSHPHSIRVLIDKIMQKSNISLNVVCHVDSFSILKSLTRSGLYHTLCPPSSFTEDIANNSLKMRSFACSSIQRQLILCKSPHFKTTHATNAVIAIICREILTMIEQGNWQATPTPDLIKTAQEYPKSIRKQVAELSYKTLSDAEF